MIEEDEFLSILTVAQRLLDVYGRHESADSSRLIYINGDLEIGSERDVIDIFFCGSLVFRHAPKGDITDFFEQHGIWINEIERIARNIPESSSGIASQRQ